MEYIFHPTTEQLLVTLKRDLPQSTLLSGIEGVGLLTVAKLLGDNNLSTILKPSQEKSASEGLISIEVVRKLYEQTRAKYTDHYIVIIDDADRMSHGAQSAFLKLLEEPNENVHFILTSHAPQKLIPTILSRVQHYTIQPISLMQSKDYIHSLNIVDSLKQLQLQFLAEGLPAELHRLTHDDTYFEKRAQIIGDAREFLQGDSYKKLLIVHKYHTNRTQTLQLINSALKILRHSISRQAQIGHITQMKQLLEIEDHLVANHNTTLQLLQFVLY